MLTPGSYTEVLTVRSLHKSFGPVKALQGVTFSVYKGEVFGLLGPNGAGKTTTVEMIAGLLSPESGSIQLFGQSPGAPVRHRLGVQPQEASLVMALTVREMLDLFASFYPDPLDVAETIERLGLTPKQGALVKELSGGQRQRLLIAIAMIGNPEMLLLDEPTSGLDPASRRQVWHVIEELGDLGKTILLTTHYMDEAERLCDRLAIMQTGQIVALGTPADLITRHVTRRTIQFEVDDGAEPALLAILADLPGLLGTQVRRAPNALQVTLQSSSLERTLPALWAHADLVKRWRGLNVASGTIEDVFLQLVGRESG